ncbi:MAG: hypothetical protein FWE31_05125 [Firmicutes bacterium]|nr:hypothetical protein [Bacillota bacterium]
MRRSIRQLLYIIAALIVIGLAIFLIWFFAFRDNSAMSIVRLPALSDRLVSDYDGSKLQLHPNGAFNIEVIFNEDRGQVRVFAGHGLWNRSGSTIYMYFVDAWGLVATGGGEGELIQNPSGNFIGETIGFDRFRRGIRFIDHNGHIFYFN